MFTDKIPEMVHEKNKQTAKISDQMQLGKRYTFLVLNVLLYTSSSEYPKKTSETEIGHQNYRFRI